MGLLSKANSFSADTKSVAKELPFSSFITSHQIQTFAIFEITDNFYNITHSIGFDGMSLLSSKSTKDFWDGICVENNKIYTFESGNKSLNPMLQFFSFDLMEQIKTVSLYKITDKIYMLCNKDFNNKIIQDLDNLSFDLDSINLDEINKNVTKDSKLEKYEIDFTEAVSSFISLKGRDFDNKEIGRNIIYQELINRFECFLCPYGVRKTSLSSIKALFNIDKSVQNEHLICHIVYYLRKVLNSTAEMVSFNNIGEGSSFADIKSFLQVE